MKCPKNSKPNKLLAKFQKANCLVIRKYAHILPNKGKINSKIL